MIFNKTLSTGTRPNGETGLFPEAYVEEIKDDGPPAMAPPPLPQVLIVTYIYIFCLSFLSSGSYLEAAPFFSHFFAG